MTKAVGGSGAAVLACVVSDHWLASVGLMSSCGRRKESRK